MTKEAHGKIAAGLEDAIAFARGDASRGRMIATVNVKEVRTKLKMSQNEFAAAYRLPVGTVRDWEQNRREPDAPARAYLAAIKRDPRTMQKLVQDV